MKITKNTTQWSNRFLSRMLAWCCRQVECPLDRIKRAEFWKRSRGSCRGTAWLRTGRIRVVIGPPSAFPVEAHNYPGRKSSVYLSPQMNDLLEALVAVTTHEVTHVRVGKGGERNAMREERRAVEAFSADREALLVKWTKEPEKAQKPSRQQKNDALARKNLELWEKNLKFAQNKVRKDRQRVRYYDRVAARKANS